MNKAILRRLSKLYSAVLCDVLDRIGHRKQGLSYTIRPLYPEARVIGTARTLCSIRKEGFPERPYEKELEALDLVCPGDVIVVAMGNDMSSGVWGELLSTAAMARGAQGAVVDGLTRDAARIIQKQFPVFARGITPYDSFGRSEVVTYDVPIDCGGVTVSPGDVIFGDYDGIIAIPHPIAEKVLCMAEEKASRELVVDGEFKRGRSVAEVFAEYGVL
ncbi:MAG: RraA family protein [Terriglobia bacterium]